MRGPWQGDWHLSTQWRYSNGGGHFSWDVACPMRTDLYAIGNGTIVDCQDGVKDQPPGRPAGSGAPSNWIILRFTAPGGKYRGKTMYAYYQHLTRGGVLVKPGQTVRRGQVIGRSGNSGNTTGPHLHLTILKPGYSMNRHTRYAYLNNPGMVCWEPSDAWGGKRYGHAYTVYVAKLKPGVKDSASVKKLREALISRGYLTVEPPMGPNRPGNDYTDRVTAAVKAWQIKKGYDRTDGILNNKQARAFFEPNTRTLVVPE
jgi:murein DD-endopeptidase MepM/ murein hydrolase activator NlpD